VYGVYSTTLVRLASGLSGHCVKKQRSLAGLCFGGRRGIDIGFSRVRTGVAETEYQLGRKRGKNKVYKQEDKRQNKNKDYCDVHCEFELRSKNLALPSHIQR
jgi:hypothetical protein